MRTSHSTRPRKLPKAQRQALILAALPAIQRLAKLYAITFAVRTMEADDLASIGVLEALECMQRGFRAKGDKSHYITGVARLAMRRYCMMHSTLITTPRKSRGYQPTLTVLSLDAPLYADSEETLLDILADDYNAAYDCYLDSLPGEGPQA